LVDSPEGSFLGKSFDSGFRARENAISPASGVRSAQGMLLQQGGSPLAGPRRKTLRAELEAPPAREAFESELEVVETPPPLARRSAPPPASELFEPEAGSEPSLTRVSAPDSTLLALARGEEQPRRRFNVKRLFLFAFAFGIAAGSVIAWVGVSDVSAQIYGARVWAANKLRSIRVHPESEAPTATGTAVEVPPTIPTIDVNQLPKAREEQAPSQGQSVAPAPTPTAPGAPALQHAPGPR
jgi:hypothetical protein